MFSGASVYGMVWPGGKDDELGQVDRMTMSGSVGGLKRDILQMKRVQKIVRSCLTQIKPAEGKFYPFYTES